MGEGEDKVPYKITGVAAQTIHILVLTYWFRMLDQIVTSIKRVA